MAFTMISFYERDENGMSQPLSFHILTDEDLPIVGDLLVFEEIGDQYIYHPNKSGGTHEVITRYPSFDIYSSRNGVDRGITGKVYSFDVKSIISD